MKALFITIMAALGLAGAALLTGEGTAMGIDTRLTKDQVKDLAFKTVNTYFPQVDPYMLMAMAQIESSLDPLAQRWEPHKNDFSFGIMQTLFDTAYWHWKDMGAREFGVPSRAELQKPEVSMYFGAQHVNWLRTFRGVNRDMEWIVRAYNGGQSWNKQLKGESKADFDKRFAMTANHWRKFKKAYEEYKGVPIA